MALKLVGLSGLKESGKSSAAAALVEDGWLKVSFADPIREALIALNPLVEVDEGGNYYTFNESLVVLGWTRAKRELPEFRRLMQVFGTEVGREIIGQDIWVDIARKKVLDLLISGHSVVLDDVRFGNEADMIRILGGQVVMIERPGTVQMDHSSEKLDFTTDHQIYNRGSIESLHSMIRSLV